MAIYVRYKVLLPLTPALTLRLVSRRRPTGHSASTASALVRRFCSEAVRKFRGYTSSLPIGGTSELMWRFAREISGGARQPVILPNLWGEYVGTRGRAPDALFSVEVFIDAGMADPAHEFMKTWKSKFERRLRQDFVLITYDIVNVIGHL